MNRFISRSIIAVLFFCGTSSCLAQGKSERIHSKWREEQKAILSHNLEEKCIRQGELAMPFTETFFGFEPADGWSLWISLHGGGGVPKDVNDSQWENQKRLYKPTEGIYVCPRAPWNAWNMWCQEPIDSMFEELVRTMVVCRNVNPDRIYILGYSAGGDGIWRLAPRLADHWAAAAMMAGHPGDVSLVNVRNLPFTIWVGAEDSAYDRNKEVAERGKVLDSLKNSDPDGYVHETHVLEGLPHWMNQRDTVALSWMEKYRRNPHPKKIVWKQEEVLRPWFYWLEVPVDEISRGKEVHAEIKGNDIYIIRCSYTTLTIYLADDMLDLSKKTTIHLPDGSQKAVKPRRSSKTLRETLHKRGDRGYMFPAKVTIKIQ